ncbi:MAG: hypothetical protein ACJ75H_17050, partial [Thermoanaerobaculia bacterium]
MGPENFEIDHFRPKSLPRFADRVNDFYNLYYTCHPCNQIKGDRWPDPALELLGYGFLDLCVDSYSDHFEEAADGTWSPRSRQAEYTLAKLRLNRSHLVRIRGYLRELAARKRYPLIDWNRPAAEQIQAL